MSLQSIFVVNTAPGCNNLIEQQVSATTCNSYIVRITQNTNALGPFDVYVSTYPDPLSAATLYYTAQTRTQMLNGVVVQLGPCVTPSPTPTPTITPTPGTTPSQTPTQTQTPTETPTQTQTPTNSETPTQTPTTTETPTETPTQTQTPTTTETPTPSTTETPTQTPTNTETPTSTPTFTPTPSTTPPIVVLDVEILLQDGENLLLQDGNPILLEQQSTAFLVSSGDPSCQVGAVSLTQTIYAASETWASVSTFYTDILLTTPFNGAGLYYTNESGGCGPCNIIDSSGNATYVGGPC